MVPPPRVNETMSPDRLQDIAYRTVHQLGSTWQDVMNGMTFEYDTPFSVPYHAVLIIHYTHQVSPSSTKLEFEYAWLQMGVVYDMVRYQETDIEMNGFNVKLPYEDVVALCETVLPQLKAPRQRMVILSINGELRFVPVTLTDEEPLQYPYRPSKGR